MDIPQVEIEADWCRPSQERDEEDEQADLDDQMPIPTHKPMDEDWGISVKKAFDDTSRTKAPCEIPASKAIVLPTTISQRAYNNFAAALREYNPKAPQTVAENMTTIFAQSGKMTPDQAKGSYTFEIRSLELFGLFVPSNFRARPVFDGNDSNVYHIIHGTTTKGASTILAEELIRPGDFTIHRDYAQCGYPSYGFYSAGEIAAKTCRFSSTIEELPRKILKIGKGTLPVQIGGIYTGRYPHSNQQAGGNDEVQRLCGKSGVARGKEKYTVARSENTRWLELSSTTRISLGTPKRYMDALTELGLHTDYFALPLVANYHIGLLWPIWRCHYCESLLSGSLVFDLCIRAPRNHLKLCVFLFPARYCTFCFTWQMHCD